MEIGENGDLMMNVAGYAEEEHERELENATTQSLHLVVLIVLVMQKKSPIVVGFHVQVCSHQFNWKVH